MYFYILTCQMVLVISFKILLKLVDWNIYQFKVISVQLQYIGHKMMTSLVETYYIMGNF